MYRITEQGVFISGIKEGVTPLTLTPKYRKEKDREGKKVIRKGVVRRNGQEITRGRNQGSQVHWW